MANFCFSYYVWVFPDLPVSASQGYLVVIFILPWIPGKPMYKLLLIPFANRISESLRFNLMTSELAWAWKGMKFQGSNKLLIRMQERSCELVPRQVPSGGLVFSWGSNDALVTIEHVPRLVIHDVLSMHGHRLWMLSAVCMHTVEGKANRGFGMSCTRLRIDRFHGLNSL